MKIFVTIVLLALPFFAFGGGSHFEAIIEQFEIRGNDEYTLYIEQYSDPYRSGAYKPRRKIIHLRYAPEKLGGSIPIELTKENYYKAINQLLLEFKKGEVFLFGVMGSGLKRIESDRSEWQSNGLALLKERDGKYVVYSFADPI